VQINLIGSDRWKSYPIWRQKTWREERELLVIPNYSEIKPLVNIA
jgi:hypothetical protein